MKNILIYIALIVPILFTSCLKDKELIGPDADGAVSNIIEFGNIDVIASQVSSEVPLFIKSFDALPSVDLVIPIKIVGVYNPSSDIKVTVEIDNNLITYYNDYQDGNFLALPSANFTVSSYDVVIPKGQRSANLVVKLLGEKYDFDNTYALGLKIKSISEGVISGNFGSVLIATIPKNIYDGIYTSIDGYVQRYTAPGSPTIDDILNGSMKGNPDVTLSSVDAETVEVGNLRWAGGTSGIAGIDNLRLRIDPATNLVTVYSVGNPTCKNIPGSVNKYDPDTETFTLNFHWNPTANMREVTNLVLKYKGSR